MAGKLRLKMAGKERDQPAGERLIKRGQGVMKKETGFYNNISFLTLLPIR